MPEPIEPSSESPDELSRVYELVRSSTGRRDRYRPIDFEIGPDGEMFVADELLVRGDDARDKLLELQEGVEARELARGWHQATGVRDVIGTLNVLIEEGHVAQPNHVFSASGCADGCGCPPHPSLGTLLQVEGASAFFGGFPFRSQPFRSQPFRSQPFRSQPFRSQPFRSQSQSPMSTARPAEAGAAMSPRTFGKGQRDRPLVIVIDTGIDNPLPGPLAPGALGGADDPLVFGETDAPDDEPAPDGYLDPVAGHGTFIAGLIQLMAPGCAQLHVSAIDHSGLITETDVGALLELIPDVLAIAGRDVIVSMSFGGPTLDKPVFLEDVTALASAATGTNGAGQPTGVALVAAAGNDGTCVPYYPAAWPTVVGVGGVGPGGPPEWTNYGPWVDACAPSADLVSTFFTFNGLLPSINGVDEDDFDGWAYWSGTSFAAPIVVAALARTIAVDDLSAPAAVEQVVRAPHLARIADLGTVVNI